MTASAIIRWAARALATLLLALYIIGGAYRWFKSFGPPAIAITSEPQPSVHRMTWRKPFAYDVAIYASPMRSYYHDQSYFFRQAQHVATLKNNSIDRNLGRIHISARIDKFTKYLHLFMQEAGKMDPHPAMGDKLLVLAHTRLFIDGKRRRARVAWEVMLDDHPFADRQMPVDVRRISVMKYLSPSERRNYSPIAWDNPLVALHDYSQSNSTDSDYQVDISLAQVSLEWMRICARFVRAPLDPFASKQSGMSPSMSSQHIRMTAIIVRLADYSKQGAVVLGIFWALGVVAQMFALVIDIEFAFGIFGASSPEPIYPKRWLAVFEPLRFVLIVVLSKELVLPGYAFSISDIGSSGPKLFALLATLVLRPVVDFRKWWPNSSNTLLARRISTVFAWTVDAVLYCLLVAEHRWFAVLMMLAVPPAAATAHSFLCAKRASEKAKGG